MARTQEQWVEETAQRDAAISVFNMAKNHYEAGYAPYLEQIDAQRSVLATELSLVQVRNDNNLAIVQLFIAAGGDWTGYEAGPREVTVRTGN